MSSTDSGFALQCLRTPPPHPSPKDKFRGDAPCAVCGEVAQQHGPAYVRRFQQRVAPLPTLLAPAAIIKGLADPMCTRKRQGNGKTVVIRGREPFRFRAFAAVPPAPGHLPAITTIFKG